MHSGTQDLWEIPNRARHAFCIDPFVHLSRLASRTYRSSLALSALAACLSFSIGCDVSDDRLGEVEEEVEQHERESEGSLQPDEEPSEESLGIRGRTRQRARDTLERDRTENADELR